MHTSELIGKFRSKRDLRDYFGGCRKWPKSLTLLTFVQYSSILPSSWVHGLKRLLQVAARWGKEVAEARWCKASSPTEVWWAIGWLSLSVGRVGFWAHDVLSRQIRKRTGLLSGLSLYCAQLSSAKCRSEHDTTCILAAQCYLWSHSGSEHYQCVWKVARWAKGTAIRKQ